MPTFELAINSTKRVYVQYNSIIDRSVGILSEAQGCDKMLSLVLKSDAPPGCVLASLSASEDLSSERRKKNDFREVYEALSNGKKRLVVEAPTSSGRSRKCPNVIINSIGTVDEEAFDLLMSCS